MGSRVLITHRRSGLAVFYDASHLQNVGLIICARFALAFLQPRAFFVSGINKQSVHLSTTRHISNPLVRAGYFKSPMP